MTHNAKEKSFVKKLSQIIFIVIVMQILFTGCSAKFVADKNFDIHEKLDIPKVVFIYDNSEMSKEAKPFFAELRKKYENRVKFYFIDANSKEAQPVLEEYALDTPETIFPFIRISDSSELESGGFSGFVEMNKQSIENFILKMIKNSTIPEWLKGKWKVVNTETKRNETEIDNLYGLAYKMLINVGNNIQFIDGKRIRFGAFPFEYELTEDNFLILQNADAKSMIFDCHINGDTLILEDDYYKIEAKKVE